LSSRSASSEPDDLLFVGRVAGHRGASGEITVRVVEVEATAWSGVSRVRLGHGRESGVWHRVERARAYRDRLVLKLGGIDGPSEAAALRGLEVTAPESECELAPGTFHPAQLRGMEVCDVRGKTLGTVREVLATGGTDVLVIRSDRESSEVLVPLAPEIVLRVEPAARRITVRLPDGLEELNRG
jgi:16S rRNA processing protein RimM